jgi:adenosylcobinamide-GDP ribazoletransferase
VNGEDRHHPPDAPPSAWPALRGIRAAACFLTRVPVGGFPYAPADWRWASAHFPLIGALIGAAMALTWWVTSPLGVAPAAVFALITSLLITGGFHEDGLADTADALGGAYDRARILEILKDSRIGSFGGLALVSSLLLRCALLVELGGAAPVALIASQAVSRMPPIWLMALMPYATDDARAKSRQINRAGPPQAIVATAWTMVVVGALVAAGYVTGASAMACVAVALLAGLVCAWRFHRRLGGVTGDFLGATQQIAEAAVLTTLVLIAR